MILLWMPREPLIIPPQSQGDDMLWTSELQCILSYLRRVEALHELLLLYWVLNEELMNIKRLLLWIIKITVCIIYFIILQIAWLRRCAFFKTQDDNEEISTWMPGGPLIKVLQLLFNARFSNQWSDKRVVAYNRHIALIVLHVKCMT